MQQMQDVNPDCRLLESEVLKRLVQHMDLNAVLACLAVSKTGEESVREVLPPELARLVQNAATKVKQQPSSAGVWVRKLSYLLRKVPRPGNHYFFPRLLHSPSIPQSIACVVLQAGARFTYHQLLSAVKAGVTGVAVWVKAYKQITGSRPLGMHPAAEAICCDGDISKALEGLNGLDVAAADLPDLLHLAMTMPEKSSTAGVDTLEVLCSLPAARDLDADTCLSLLKTAVLSHDPDGVNVLLARLPAVHELPVYNIISLLGVAVQARLHLTVHKFCQLPAAQQMTSATAYSFLQSAVQTSSAELVIAICHDMQQARGLTAHQIADLLRTVADSAQISGSTQQFTALVALPGAAAIDATAVTSLIAAVLSSADGSSCQQKVEALDALCSLPATQEINANTCLDLLMTAVQSQSRVASAPLVGVLLASLPAVQQLPLNSIISLLRAVVNARLHQAVHKIFQLPAAHQITSTTAYSLLQRAVQKSSAEMVRTICDDMAVQLEQSLTALQVANLLQAGLEYIISCGNATSGGTQKLRALIALPAAADIDAMTAAHLLRVAVESAKRNSSTTQLKVLVALPGAAAIDAATVANLLQAALESSEKPGSFQQLKALVRLPGAAAIDAATVASLIAAVLSSAGGSGCQEDIEALVALQGARSIGVSAAVDLIHMAVTHGNYHEANLLLQLPAAQHLQQSQFMLLLNDAEAAGTRCKSTVLALLQLPAAQLIDNHHVAKLAEMVYHEDTNSLQAYLRSHAAQRLAQTGQRHFADGVPVANNVLSGFIQTAAAAGLWLSVVALCEAEPAAQFGIPVLAEILSSAMTAATIDHEGMPSERPTYKILTVLLEKAEARQLPVQHLELLLLKAAAGGYHTQDHVRKLLQLPAAQELTSSTVTAAIKELIIVSDVQHWANYSVVGELLSLNAAGSIVSSELSSLVESTISSRQWQTAARLIRLPPAAIFVTSDMLLKIVLGLLDAFNDATSEALVVALQQLDLPGLKAIVQWVAKRHSALALWRGNSAVRFRSDLSTQVSQLSAQQAARL